MEWLSLASIIVSLALLIFLALRGFSIIIIAPVASLVVILMNGMPILESLQDNYMSGFINFAKNNYLIFLFSAMFGKFMEDSGAARKIAESLLKLTNKISGKKSKYGVLVSVVIITAVLTYGGVNVFVVIFAVMPIAKPLFREMDIPWHLFMGAFFFGMATFSMTMLPGTPSIQNIIPTNYLGTTTTAAPLLGIVGSIIIIIINLFYLKYALVKTEKRGETYFNMKNPDGTSGDVDQYEGKKLPPLLLSITPPLFLLIVLNIVKLEVVYTLMLTVILSSIVFWKYIDKKLSTVNVGATNTVLPIVNTSADVGYGTVIAATAGFGLVTEMMANMPGSPFISLYLATTILAGITGSASGGLGISMETLMDTYTKLNLDPEVIHRIAVMASGGLDSLPHNGAVITALAVVGLTHKDAYKHIFATTVVAPILTAIPVLILAVLLY